MPLGSFHEVTGLLLPGPSLPVLRVDGGGEWRLDVSGLIFHLYGKRVVVTGSRGDFDILDVTKIRKVKS